MKTSLVMSLLRDSYKKSDFFSPCPYMVFSYIDKENTSIVSFPVDPLFPSIVAKTHPDILNNKNTTSFPEAFTGVVAKPCKFVIVPDKVDFNAILRFYYVFYNGIETSVADEIIQSLHVEGKVFESKVMSSSILNEVDETILKAGVILEKIKKGEIQVKEDGVVIDGIFHKTSSKFFEDIFVPFTKIQSQKVSPEPLSAFVKEKETIEEKLPEKQEVQREQEEEQRENIVTDIAFDDEEATEEIKSIDDIVDIVTSSDDYSPEVFIDDEEEEEEERSEEIQEPRKEDKHEEKKAIEIIDIPCVINNKENDEDDLVKQHATANVKKDFHRFSKKDYGVSREEKQKDKKIKFGKEKEKIFRVLINDTDAGIKSGTVEKKEKVATAVESENTEEKRRETETLVRLPLRDVAIRFFIDFLSACSYYFSTPVIKYVGAKSNVESEMFNLLAESGINDISSFKIVPYYRFLCDIENDNFKLESGNVIKFAQQAFRLLSEIPNFESRKYVQKMVAVAYILQKVVPFEWVRREISATKILEKEMERATIHFENFFSVPKDTSKILYFLEERAREFLPQSVFEDEEPIFVRSDVSFFEMVVSNFSFLNWDRAMSEKKNCFAVFYNFVEQSTKNMNERERDEIRKFLTLFKEKAKDSGLFDDILYSIHLVEK